MMNDRLIMMEMMRDRLMMEMMRDRSITLLLKRSSLEKLGGFIAVLWCLLLECYGVTSIKVVCTYSIFVLTHMRSFIDIAFVFNTGGVKKSPKLAASVFLWTEHVSLGSRMLDRASNASSRRFFVAKSGSRDFLTSNKFGATSKAAACTCCPSKHVFLVSSDISYKFGEASKAIAGTFFSVNAVFLESSDM